VTKFGLCLVILQVYMGLSFSSTASARLGKQPQTPSQRMAVCLLNLNIGHPEELSVIDSLKVEAPIVGDPKGIFPDPRFKTMAIDSFMAKATETDSLAEVRRNGKIFGGSLMDKFIDSELPVFAEKIPQYVKANAQGVLVMDPQFRSYLKIIFSGKIIYEGESRSRERRILQTGKDPEPDREDPYRGLLHTEKKQKATIDEVEKITIKKFNNDNEITNPHILALVGTPLAYIFDGDVDVTSDKAPVSRRIKFSLAVGAQENPTHEDLEILVKWSRNFKRDDATLQATALLGLGLHNKMDLVDFVWKQMSDQDKKDCLTEWNRHTLAAINFASQMTGDLLPLKRTIEENIAAHFHGSR
jgi:hypothetical protein